MPNNVSLLVFSLSTAFGGIFFAAKLLRRGMIPGGRYGTDWVNGTRRSEHPVRYWFFASILLGVCALLCMPLAVVLLRAAGLM
ncbi:MAG: hypothetical protein KGL53_03285 [Elusimicrobia bacterium]|nr:hypothetical protein [Elusimicrobiota bacterium]